MRVLAGRLGLPPDVWCHLPPDVERARLVEYCHSVLDELPRQGLTLEAYLEVIDRRDGVEFENILRFPIS